MDDGDFVTRTLDGEFDEDTFFEGDEVIRAKWMLDGATTLDEAASKLREVADRLIKLSEEGWKLRRAIEDDYGFMFKANE